MHHQQNSVFYIENTVIKIELALAFEIITFQSLDALQN